MAIEVLGHIPYGKSPALVNVVSFKEMDAAGEELGQVIMLPKSGNISKVGIRTSNVTVADSLFLSLETVNPANGEPTGTDYGGSTGIDLGVVAANTLYEGTLAVAATAVLGDIVAVVASWTSYVAGDLRISIGDSGSSFGYVSLNAGGWVHDDQFPMVTIGYDDGTYVDVGALPNAPLLTNFNSTDTPDEIGNVFTLPLGGQCVGMWVDIDADNAADLILYTGTTPTATVSLDPDVRGSTAGGYSCVYFAAETLLADTEYRVIVKPTTGSDVTAYRIELGSAPMMDSLPAGTAMYRTGRTDAAGSWTDVDDERILCGPILDGFEAGAGGGGAYVH